MPSDEARSVPLPTPGRGEPAAVIKDLLRWAMATGDIAETFPKNDQGSAT